MEGAGKPVFIRHTPVSFASLVVLRRSIFTDLGVNFQSQNSAATNTKGSLRMDYVSCHKRIIYRPSGRGLGAADDTGVVGADCGSTIV